MKSRQSTERGQVLVLLVLGIVALLGFTAFAIDGGMVYSDRRHAQNGADAASLTGGGAASNALETLFNNVATKSAIYDWNCSSSYLVNAQLAARNAAVAQAADNGYTIDQDITDLNGVSTECGEVNYVGWSQKFIDVITYVTRDTPTSFAQFVFGGPLTNSVEAVTRLEPPHDLAYGNAVFALREDCPNNSTGGVTFTGTSPTTVTDGGIFSNACMRGNGNASVTVYGGNIACVGETDDEFCYTDNGAEESPAPIDLPQENRILREDFGFDPDVLDAICSDLPYYGDSPSEGVISQGRYDRIRVNANNAILYMQPGLYCVSGVVTLNGMGLIGHGVTIYLTSGEFRTNGDMTVKLSAPPQETATIGSYVLPYFSDDEEPVGTGFGDWMVNALGYTAPAAPSGLGLIDELYPAGSKAIRGLLLYSRDGNTNPISLLGDSDSYYIGTVYAPDGSIEAGGSSDLGMIAGQLIADTVFIGGNAELEIKYDNEVTMYVSTELELHE